MSSITLGHQATETTPVPLDPRSICNLILDEADRDQTPISHVVLQKLLYFTHAIYLIRHKHPLASGYFEAWEHGPVHPGAFVAFKRAGFRDIDFRAMREDPLTGEKQPLPNPQSPLVIGVAHQVVRSYAHIDPRRLIAISHATGGPWDHVVKQGRNSMVFGLRISDKIIVELFKNHKIAVGEGQATIGDISEDTPFA